MTGLVVAVLLAPWAAYGLLSFVRLVRARSRRAQAEREAALLAQYEAYFGTDGWRRRWPTYEEADR